MSFNKGSDNHKIIKNDDSSDQVENDDHEKTIMMRVQGNHHEQQDV